MNYIPFHDIDKKTGQGGNVNWRGKHSSIHIKTGKEQKMSNSQKSTEALIYSIAWGF